MKKALIALVLILVVGFGGYELYKAEAPVASFGAVSGPDITADHWGVNGVITYYTRQIMTQATTTICAIKSPGATTTIRSFVANFTNASSSAISTIYLAKDPTGYGTTTNLETATLAAGIQGTIIASSTNRTNFLPVVAPNTYLTVALSGGLGNVPTGACIAVLEGI